MLTLGQGSETAVAQAGSGEIPARGNEEGFPVRRKELAILLSVAAFLRLVFLSHFPEVQADEGLWTISTKNLLSHGDWFMDGRKHLFLSPVFHGVTLLSFSVLDASLTAARTVSALFGAGTVFLVFLLGRSLFDRYTGFFAALVFGLSEWSVFTARTALVESTQIFFVVLAALLLVDRRWTLAGVAMALALLTKVNIVFLLPVFLFYILQVGSSWNRRLRDSLKFLAGSVIPAALVYGALYLWSPDRFVQAFAFELRGAQFDPGNPLFHVGRFSFDPAKASRSLLELFREDPFFMILGVLGVGLALLDGRR